MPNRPTTARQYNAQRGVTTEPERITTADLRALQFPSMEKDLVQDIRTHLEALGYLVATVGQYRAKGSGTTVGYPDMSIRHALWPRGMALLLEVKTKAGKPSSEQERLHSVGWSYIVRSVDDAVDAVRAFGRERGAL